MSNRLKNVWHETKNRGENIGLTFIILGVLVLLTQTALVLSGSLAETGLFSAALALLSVGLGFIVVGTSAKSDKTYTEILKRMDRNIVQILANYKDYETTLDTVQQPVGNVTVKVEPAAVATDVRGKVTDEKKNRVAAQKRLDEDTKRVGICQRRSI